MGPEPYTFLIILAERMGYFTFKNVYMDATDIDETGHFGEIVTAGVYPEADLKRIPEDIFKKYFSEYSEKPGYCIIDQNVRNRIKFTTHDLLSLKPVGENYNLIICKNVLLHFQYEERIKVIEMYHSVLEKGGMFTTEQTQQMPKECSHLFKKLASDANVYQKI